MRLFLSLKSLHGFGLIFRNETSEDGNKDSEDSDSVNGKENGEDLTRHRGRLVISVSTSRTRKYKLRIIAEEWRKGGKM